MTDAHMHNHAPEGGHWAPGSRDLIAAAQQAMEMRGVQWTDLRASVFATLAQGQKPVSAYDVADALSQQNGRRIAPNSVYRILDLFVEHNLAKRIESRNAYVANTHPSCSHDCIFLVCESCGKIDHIDDDVLANGMRERASLNGFRPSRPVLELLGQCAACLG